MLGVRDEPEERESEQRAEHGPRRRRDLGVAVQDPRERDAGRAEEGRQPRSLREPVERVEDQERFSGRPTKRSPSSANWLSSGTDGASSIRSLPDWVLGKAITSRMLVCSARSAAQRSIPSAMPPCGGAPNSNASSTAPNFSFMAFSEWPWSRNERSSRSRRWIRTEPPPSSQPLRARSYCMARARPAGSSGAGLAGSPEFVTSSASSSGSTPLNGLWVASQRPTSASHWYIGKRWTQT